MAALRNVPLVLVVAFLIASFGVEANFMPPTVNAAPVSLEPTVNAIVASVALEDIPDPQTNALHQLSTDLWIVATNTEYQWAFAIFVLVTGVVSLWHGPSFFKMLVVLFACALTSSIVLSQLTHSPWTSELGSKLKFVVSLEVGLFVGYATYMGWEGTQYLLGLALGMYLYHTVQGFAAVIQIMHNVSQHSVWQANAATLLVALCTWLLHDKGGAERLFTILCPLFGSSLVVAACGYLFAKISHVPDASVVDFWFMIANPMHSPAVGYFTMKNEGDLDRVAGIFFWMLLFVVGMVTQYRKMSSKTHESLQVSQLQTKINQLEASLLDSPNRKIAISQN